jgi:hypothetical protein
MLKLIVRGTVRGSLSRRQRKKETGRKRILLANKVDYHPDKNLTNITINVDSLPEIHFSI